MVLKVLWNFDINKATGINMTPSTEIPTPYIADEITFICNHSITNSVFQTNGKKQK